jgi:hypothetical protein
VDPEAVPLSREDRSILDLEQGPVRGHTCKIIRLPGAGSLPITGALRDSISARIAEAPLLLRRLGGTTQRPVWEPVPGVDIDQHVVDGTRTAPLDRAAFRAEVARLFSERLDRSRPLWRLDVVGPLEDGGSALVSGFLARELGRADAPSPFDGEITSEREVAFVSMPLRRLHDAARAHDRATVNDALLSVVTGGMRRWLQRRHGPLGDIRVRVPVSLHAAGDAAGNRDSFFHLTVPMHEQDPVARLAAIHAETALRKAEHDAETMDEVLRELARISPGLAGLAEQVELSPRSFAVSISNVPGPATAVSVLGVPVASMHALAEIRQRHALRVAAISLGDGLHIGLCADPTIVPGVDELAEDIAAEGDALTTVDVEE